MDENESIFSVPGKQTWLTWVEDKLPLGSHVLVIRSDLPEYEGLYGWVVGYDVGDESSCPLVSVLLSPGAGVDGFYFFGLDDDEIISSPTNTPREDFP